MHRRSGRNAVVALMTRGIALALIALSLSGAAASRAQTDSGALSEVGTLERIPADARAAFGDEIVPDGFFTGEPLDSRSSVAGTLIVLPEVRQLWQVYPLRSSSETAVAVRSLDSNELIATFKTPGGLFRSGSSSGEWMHVVDGTRRIFLAHTVFGQGLGALEVDLQSFETRHWPFNPSAFATFGTFAGVSLGGLSFDPHGERLVALFGAVAGLNLANTTTFVYGLGVGPDNAGETSIRLLRSCGGPLPPADGTLFSSYGFPVLFRPDHAWIPCHRAGNSGAVVRLSRTALFDASSEEVMAIGPANLRNSFADQQSGRIFLMTANGEIWVFEAASMSFIGVVPANADRAASNLVAFGIDTVSGRLFYLSPTFGLGVVEGRFFPVPQARTLPDRASEASERIYSDYKTGKFYVLPGSFAGRPTFYTVYHGGTAPTPPPPPDPDRNTVDVDEKPGVTESRYFASGNGYGARVLIANGLATVVPAPTVGPASPIASIIGSQGVSRCGFTDRELVAGRVAKAEYDTGSTAASAIAVDVDERTKLDLDKPSRCDLRMSSVEAFKGLFGTSPETTAPAQEAIENQDPENPRWGRKPASCSSSEGEKPEEATGKDEGLAGDVSFGTSKVQCPVPGKPLHATAVSRLTGPVAVGHASTKVDITREPHAVRSVVESWARDIELQVSEQTSVHIGEVWAKATSFANGRPSKGPQSLYEFAIKRVRIGNTELCAENCDPRRTLAHLNQILAGRVEFRVAEGIDESLQMGSLKGALTAVQKSVQRQTSDRSLIGDFTNEVAALDMVVYNDNSNWGRARQLYQFAGVSSAATYNISLLPGGSPFPDDGPSDDDAGDGDEGAAFAEGSGGGEAFGGAQASNGGRDGGNGGLLGAVRDAIDALVRGIRLFFTNPRQGLLLVTGWALFFLPGILARRRMRLLASI